MASQVQDDFMPIPPAAGRDWLARGFGVRRCICARCLPKKAAPNAHIPTAPVEAANLIQVGELNADALAELGEANNA
jgi:hypothetical protein